MQTYRQNLRVRHPATIQRPSKSLYSPSRPIAARGVRRCTCHTAQQRQQQCQQQQHCNDWRRNVPEPPNAGSSTVAARRPLPPAAGVCLWPFVGGRRRPPHLSNRRRRGSVKRVVHSSGGRLKCSLLCSIVACRGRGGVLTGIRPRVVVSQS